MRKITIIKRVEPDRAVESILSAPVRVASRYESAGKISLHVSDLIRSAKSEAFCPRNAAFTIKARSNKAGESLYASQALLFSYGHALEDHIRERVIADPVYGKHVYGKWSCPCKKSGFEGTYAKARQTECGVCGLYCTVYSEIDVLDRKNGITAHPDLILDYGRRLHLYEIKSLDRKDLTIYDLTGPLGDHVLQASMYYHIMRASGYPVHDRLHFLYGDRGNPRFGKSPFREFIKTASPVTRVQPFLDKAAEVVQFRKDGILPSRTCRDMQCPRAKNCQHAIACFNQ